MKPEAYIEMAQTESEHWWYKARRKIIASIIADMNLPNNSQILEVGCGTGGNLEMLAHFGEVSALELDDTARDIALAKAKGSAEIRKGCCPDDIPFQERSYDLVCMFDVLEHVDEDGPTLEALTRLLHPGGYLLVTVPAYQWMWSKHDEYLHHKRRYTSGQLRGMFSELNIDIHRTSYFNTLLFPLAVMARLGDRLKKSSDTGIGVQIPPSYVNRLLYSVFVSEKWLLKFLRLPYGVSLYCLAKNGSS